MIACRVPIAIFVALLAACRPPASDRYVERIALDGANKGPQVQMTSPDVSKAVWAPSETPERIVFGQPGQAPLLAIECWGAGRMIKVTRFAPTEPYAEGMMALVGNGHVERLKIDALDQGEGRGWLWQGRYAPTDTRLDALTGSRRLEVTIPGAGTLVVTGGQPGELIERCRRIAPSGPTAQMPPAPPA
ncbi:hypothetical protein ACWPMX_10650 [Tsuneonella sp. HG094]